MLAHCSALPDQLIQPLLFDLAIPVRIRVDTVIGAGHRTIDSYPESDRLALSAWTEHEMKIPCVEPIRNASRRFAPYLFLWIDFPRPVQRPLIQFECSGNAVRLRPVVDQSTGRAEVLRTCIPKVCLRRLVVGFVGGRLYADGAIGRRAGCR